MQRLKKTLLIILFAVLVCLLVSLLWGNPAMYALLAGTAFGWCLQAAGVGDPLAEKVRPPLLRAGATLEGWIGGWRDSAAPDSPDPTEERLDPRHGGVGQAPRDTTISSGLDEEKFQIRRSRDA